MTRLEHLVVPGAPPVTVSELAVAEPTAQPRTGDMVEMVEHLRRLGQIRKKPCAFSTAFGLIVHPQLYHELRRSMAARSRFTAEVTS